MDESTTRIPLQISGGVIIVPIRYNLTHTVLDRLKTDLLAFVTEHDARSVVFDLKGVEILDAEDFEGLMRIMRMIQIMGLTVALCGLSPGIVTSIIELGLDIGGISTMLDLDTALSNLSKK